jgi:hypothetical protein
MRPAHCENSKTNIVESGCMNNGPVHVERRVKQSPLDLESLRADRNGI